MLAHPSALARVSQNHVPGPKVVQNPIEKGLISLPPPLEPLPGQVPRDPVPQPYYSPLPPRDATPPSYSPYSPYSPTPSPMAPDTPEASVDIPTPSPSVGSATVPPSSPVPLPNVPGVPNKRALSPIVIESSLSSDYCTDDESSSSDDWIFPPNTDYIALLPRDVFEYTLSFLDIEEFFDRSDWTQKLWRLNKYWYDVCHEIIDEIYKDPFSNCVVCGRPDCFVICEAKHHNPRLDWQHVLCFDHADSDHLCPFPHYD